MPGSVTLLKLAARLLAGKTELRLREERFAPAALRLANLRLTA